MKEFAATVGGWIATGVLLSAAIGWLYGTDLEGFAWATGYAVTASALHGLHAWWAGFSTRRALDRALRPIREELNLRSRALGCGPDAPFAWFEALRRRGARPPASTGRLIRLWARAVDRDDPFAVPLELRRPF